MGSSKFDEKDFENYFKNISKFSEFLTSFTVDSVEEESNSKETNDKVVEFLKNHIKDELKEEHGWDKF